ncbi:MAG: hypothetical protein HZB38_18015 [Planctomycetes bacterium]|nr:hypothetical protein [Planctomycetota bacterium]
MVRKAHLVFAIFWFAAAIVVPSWQSLVLDQQSVRAVTAVHDCARRGLIDAGAIQKLREGASGDSVGGDAASAAARYLVLDHVYRVQSTFDVFSWGYLVIAVTHGVIWFVDKRRAAVPRSATLE